MQKGVFDGPLGYALLRRWRWIQDARDRGISYGEAEAEFSALIDRERAALKAAERERARIAAKTLAERNSSKYRKTAAEDVDDLLEYGAKRLG
jgi:hypothetical protein